MLSPGEPRDADISFDTTASCMQFLDLAQHRFLVCHAYISDRSNTEIAPHSTLIFTAVTQSHGDNQRSRHTTKITGKTHVNTWLSYSYSAKKCYNAYVRPLTLVHSSNNPIDIYSSVTSVIINSKALLSQWKPRDAAENFDTYRNLQPHRAVLPPCFLLSLFSCRSEMRWRSKLDIPVAQERLHSERSWAVVSQVTGIGITME